MACPVVEEYSRHVVSLEYQVFLLLQWNAQRMNPASFSGV